VRHVAAEVADRNPLHGVYLVGIRHACSPGEHVAGEVGQVRRRVRVDPLRVSALAGLSGRSPRGPRAPRPRPARSCQRFPIGAVVAFGFVLTAAGQALMILTLHHGVHDYAAAILPGWVVIGFGLGFTVPTIIGSATVDLPPEQSATGSAVVNSGRKVRRRLRRVDPGRGPGEGRGHRGSQPLLRAVVGGRRPVRRRCCCLPWAHPQTPARQGRRHGSRSRRGDRQYQQFSGMSLHRPSAPGQRFIPMKRPVGALPLLAGPETLSAFGTRPGSTPRSCGTSCWSWQPSRSAPSPPRCSETAPTPRPRLPPPPMPRRPPTPASSRSPSPRS
jgi:hypothetical protein